MKSLYLHLWLIDSIIECTPHTGPNCSGRINFINYTTGIIHDRSIIKWRPLLTRRRRAARTDYELLSLCHFIEKVNIYSRWSIRRPAERPAATSSHLCEDPVSSAQSIRAVNVAKGLKYRAPWRLSGEAATRYTRQLSADHVIYCLRPAGSNRETAMASHRRRLIVLHTPRRGSICISGKGQKWNTNGEKTQLWSRDAVSLG